MIIFYLFLENVSRVWIWLQKKFGFLFVFCFSYICLIYSKYKRNNSLFQGEYITNDFDHNNNHFLWKLQSTKSRSSLGKAIVAKCNIKYIFINERTSEHIHVCIFEKYEPRSNLGISTWSLSIMWKSCKND